VIITIIGLSIGLVLSYKCGVYSVSYRTQILNGLQLSSQIDRDVNIALNDIEIIRFLGRISIVMEGVSEDNNDMEKRKEVNMSLVTR